MRTGKNIVIQTAFLIFTVIGIATVYGEPARWDYTRHPVVALPKVPELETNHLFRAFDGFGAQGSRPGAVGRWTATVPAVCELDYGEPVAISAFVHYFYVPDGRDYQYFSSSPSAFKTVRIWSKQGGGSYSYDTSRNENFNVSDTQMEWQLIAELIDLPTACPQIIVIPDNKPARFWKLEIVEMAPGASLLTYEIETYTGGTPILDASADPPYDNIPKDFTQRMLTHRPSTGSVKGSLSLSPDNHAVIATLSHKDRQARCELSVIYSGNTVQLVETGSHQWKGAIDGGNIILESRDTNMGQLVSLRYAADAAQTVRYRNVALKMDAADVRVYYLPGLAWSTEPVTLMPNISTVYTACAGLCVDGISMGMLPSTDRGTLGFDNGSARFDLIAGEEPVNVLITGIAGDWWDLYGFAVSEVFHFTEQQQTVPVSEIQYGVSRYLLSDDVWEQHTNTLKVWPDYDPIRWNILWEDGVDLHAFYGAPYSIPAYLDRYIMNGDRLALERARDIVRWLCRSNVRMQTGPARGAFFNLQRFREGEVPSIFKPGTTQANTSIMTSQSTGAILWALLYYRSITGTDDAEVDMVINEAVRWLMQTRNAEGGWPYGHYTDGSEVKFAHGYDGRPIEAQSSSGCIWNIWALWRYGKITGNSEYIDAAAQSLKWYDRTFIKQHHFHGYWEDGGPGTREGYEAGVAAVACTEMGENDLAVAAAREAVQWVYTRRLECREAHNSAGLVGEQPGWPPAPYCNPIMGLAAWNAWRITGDSFWKPYAMMPKALGWWYSPDKGTVDWVYDSIQHAPMAGTVWVSWWSDWVMSQVGSLSLRWLIREIGRCSGDAIVIDEERLTGTAFGGVVRCWAPPGGIHPNLPILGQANWLGLIGDKSVMIAFVNHGPEDQINCRLDSRDLNGAIVWPKRAYRVAGGKVETIDWDGTTPVQIGKEGVTVLEWGFRR